jgi:hypothetical protein
MAWINQAPGSCFERLLVISDTGHGGDTWGFVSANGFFEVIGVSMSLAMASHDVALLDQLASNFSRTIDAALPAPQIDREAANARVRAAGLWLLGAGAVILVLVGVGCASRQGRGAEPRRGDHPDALSLAQFAVVSHGEVRSHAIYIRCWIFVERLLVSVGGGVRCGVRGADLTAALPGGAADLGVGCDGRVSTGFGWDGVLAEAGLVENAAAVRRGVETAEADWNTWLEARPAAGAAGAAASAQGICRCLWVVGLSVYVGFGAF